MRPGMARGTGAVFTAPTASAASASRWYASKASSSRCFGRHVLLRRGAAAAARSRQERWLRSEPAGLQLPRAQPGPSTSSTALPLLLLPPTATPTPRVPVSLHSPPHSTPCSFLAPLGYQHITFLATCSQAALAGALTAPLLQALRFLYPGREGMRRSGTQRCTRSGKGEDRRGERGERGSFFPSLLSPPSRPDLATPSLRLLSQHLAEETPLHENRSLPKRCGCTWDPA